ncbi:TPA: hypothetical protein HA231_05770 [Candidatus Woesearchaeota archaeon]|nr:hypothetical protein [Candidatus Woesearchaeota archaeon]
MPGFDTIAMNLLGAVAYAVGAYIAVEYVLPKVKVIAAEVLRYPKTAEALVYLLSITVYLAAAQGIIGRIVAMGMPYLSTYINVINPVIDVMNGMMPVVKTLLLGIGIVLLAERVRLRA